MSISKLDQGTYIDWAKYDPDTVTGRKPIHIGTKKVKDIAVGNFVKASDDSWNKVTANAATSDQSVKTVVLENGASITVASSDSLSVGDSITTVGGTFNIIEITTLSDNSTVHQLTVEGSNNFIAGTIVVG